MPSIVRTLIARHESCSTSPIVSPARIMSPTWTVRSIASAMPEKRLPSVSWSARPRTAVMIAEVVSRAGRLTESSILNRMPSSRPKTSRLTSCRSSSGAGVPRRRRNPTSKRTKSRMRTTSSAPARPTANCAVVLRRAGIDQRNARAGEDRDQSGDDGEEQQRGQEASRRLGQAGGRRRSSGGDPLRGFARVGGFLEEADRGDSGDPVAVRIELREALLRHARRSRRPRSRATRRAAARPAPRDRGERRRRAWRACRRSGR